MSRPASPQSAPARLPGVDPPPPQLPLLDLAQGSGRCGVLELPRGMLFAKPAAEIAHPRGGPNVQARIQLRPFHRIEQRGRKFGVGCENRMAVRDGRHQAGQGGFDAQRCRSFGREPTSCSSGRAAACASSNSSMRANTVASTCGSGRLVMRKQFLYGTLKLTPGATKTCLFSNRSSAKVWSSKSGSTSLRTSTNEYSAPMGRESRKYLLRAMLSRIVWRDSYRRPPGRVSSRML